MRSSITVLFILINIILCLVWSAAKKIKDEDFSEFDDFDEDEFVVGMKRLIDSQRQFYLYSRNAIIVRC
jgi:hypothetical protein